MTPGVQRWALMSIKLTIFLLQIILGRFHKLSNYRSLLNKGRFRILQTVANLVIESQPRRVSLPIAQGWWGIDGNGWDFMQGER